MTARERAEQAVFAEWKKMSKRAKDCIMVDRVVNAILAAEADALERAAQLVESHGSQLDNHSARWHAAEIRKLKEQGVTR